MGKQEYLELSSFWNNQERSDNCEFLSRERISQAQRRRLLSQAPTKKGWQNMTSVKAAEGDRKINKYYNNNLVHVSCLSYPLNKVKDSTLSIKSICKIPDRFKVSSQLEKENTLKNFRYNRLKGNWTKIRECRRVTLFGNWSDDRILPSLWEYSVYACGTWCWLEADIIILKLSQWEFLFGHWTKYVFPGNGVPQGSGLASLIF